MHRVIWHLNQTYQSICTTYINYVKHHFGATSVIVFDGYTNNAINTKKYEQHRRSLKYTSADIFFDNTITATVAQDKFLSNENNKNRLISMLMEKFKD